MSEALHDPVKIGIVSISDRASTGVYEDKGLPALQDWLTRALLNPITFEPRLIPDEQDTISATLIDLVNEGCSLVLTTGGTGPAPRDGAAGATVAGAAIFLVPWPFAALGGNTEETWDSLVADPAAYTFKRPLGDFDHERPLHPPAAP